MVDKSPQKSTDESVKAVQENLDVEHERGYRGETVDKTPREAYTVKGVTSK